MSRADLVVTCRGTGGPILTADVVAPVAAERLGRPGGLVARSSSSTWP